MTPDPQPAYAAQAIVMLGIFMLIAIAVNSQTVIRFF